LGGSYNGHHDIISTNALQNIAGIQAGPAWLENHAAGSALDLQYAFMNRYQMHVACLFALCFKHVYDDSKCIFGTKG